MKLQGQIVDIQNRRIFKGEISVENGKIISIKENISQDLFVIDHNKNEVLIPIHDEFIVEVDKKKNQIIVKTPEGLIDLYIN